MRVISGSAKGHKLKSVKKISTRAVTDRVKEGIFSVLGSISDEKVLDLFAGTGSLGIEALSRGADSCVFVDRSRGCAKTIRANLKSTGLKGKVYVRDLRAGLRRFRGKSFGLVFIDPPFSSSLAEGLLQEIGERDIVGSEGVVVVRLHSKKKMPDKIGHLVLEKKQIYGENAVFFMELSGSPCQAERENN